MEPQAFAEAVERWHDFYLLVGTASATLVGLLFVALTLNLAKMKAEQFNNVRNLAYRTFYAFIYLLLVAGVMLIPRQDPLGTGVPLALISGIGILNTLRNIAAMQRHGQSAGMNGISRRFLLVLLALAGLLVVAVCLGSGRAEALYWLTGAVLALLVSATENAWDMFMGLYGE